MGYQPLEELLPKSGWSIYGLARLASVRAQELADNKPRLIQAPLNQKLVTVALDEIRAGKVVSKSVADQFDPDKIKDKTN